MEARISLRLASRYHKLDECTVPNIRKRPIVQCGECSDVPASTDTNGCTVRIRDKAHISSPPLFSVPIVAQSRFAVYG
jgi:hypothetical protein